MYLLINVFDEMDQAFYIFIDNFKYIFDKHLACVTHDDLSIKYILGRDRNRDNRLCHHAGAVTVKTVSS